MMVKGVVGYHLVTLEVLMANMSQSMEYIYRQKELLRRRDHNMLVFLVGAKMPIESGASLGGCDSAGVYRSSCGETVQQAQDWSGTIYVIRGIVILMGWRRMCLWTNRQWGYNLVKLWSKEVLMDRSWCRNIRTLGVTDIGSAGGDGE